MLATSSAQNLPHVILIEDLGKPLGERGSMIYIPHVRIRSNWMDPIIQFLSKDVLLEDKSEAEKIRRKALRFWLSEDQKLYKRSFSRPYLLCIHLEASELLLKELHEGIYGSHTGGRSITHRDHPGLLVAKHAKGSIRIYEEVRSMSNICTEHTPTRRISKSPLQSLALCTMGLGYCWLIS